MEQNFQTSFIPKKPVIEMKTTGKRPVGVLVLVSVLLFVTMAIASGGAYFYKGVLTGNITKMQEDLSKAKNRFEPTQITKLKLLDKRLQASNQILSNHVAIHPVFDLLQSVTLKSVMYKTFNYSINEKTKNVSVNIDGMGLGYRSIALQADLFSKNKNFIDPIFSGLSLDDKGNVLFNLKFEVSSGFLNYKQVVKTEKEFSSPATEVVPITSSSNPAGPGTSN